jgi:PleD family two-component response regulator
MMADVGRRATGVVLVVDDLFFSIKIKTAAQHLGAEIFFERTGAHTLDTIKEKKPRLVIFDLDAAKLRPIETVAAMKDDPELRSVPTLGFVSHVHADTIAAARAAGIDQVLARSAFADRLGVILGDPPG